MSLPSLRRDLERMLREPSPFVVDVFGIRERRPGEPPQKQMSSAARWDAFERRRAARAVGRIARLLAELAGHHRKCGEVRDAA